MAVVATFVPAGADADFLAMLGALLLVVAAAVFLTIRHERRVARADAEARLAAGPAADAGAVPREGDDASP